MSLPTLFADRIYFGCPAGIFLSHFDSKIGTVGEPHQVAEAENSSFLVFSTEGDFLYSVAEKTDGAVIAWKVAADGALTKLNERSSGGSGPCHLAISPSGKVLPVANYSSGSVASFPLNIDGSVGPQASSIMLNGSGPDAKRQTAPHAHGGYFSPD